MAKTTEEIKELLSSPLFIEGQKSNYISISEKSDITYIEYHCKNGAKRKLQNPEEFVQATAFLRLIDGTRSWYLFRLYASHLSIK